MVMWCLLAVAAVSIAAAVLGYLARPARWINPARGHPPLQGAVLVLLDNTAITIYAFIFLAVAMALRFDDPAWLILLATYPAGWLTLSAGRALRERHESSR